MPKTTTHIKTRSKSAEIIPIDPEILKLTAKELALFNRARQSYLQDGVPYTVADFRRAREKGLIGLKIMELQARQMELYAETFGDRRAKELAMLRSENGAKETLLQHRHEIELDKKSQRKHC
jgi:hypothetical protein